jgi:hypothetical protein
VTVDKRIITPEHFKVAPEVLGLPLASPSRRAFAMVIDLIMIALLVKVGGAFLGFVAAFLLFRASKANQREGFFRMSVRMGLRLIAAVILFAVSMTAWNKINDRVKRDDEAEVETAGAVDPGANSDLNLNIPARQLPALAGALFSIRQADDSSEVEASVEQVLKVAREAGASPSQIHEARTDLVEMLGDDADSSAIRAVDSAIAAVAVARPHATDSVAVTIASLEREVEGYRAKNEKLQKDLEEAKKSHGIRYFMASAADDLGVGFGWSAVFFTAFLALWRGQTPGKKIVGVRVIRLDGKPMGWWLAFERFGGYAASLSVGLLGFVQILWDRNRQGLHDKACETVVVMDSAQALSRS